MMDIFLEHKLLSSFILIFLLLSIICQIMIGVIYQRLIRETENMSSTENKLLKQCKLKFTNCFQLNAGVANIPVFVDKFISKIAIMRITLRGIQHLSGQMMLLSVLAAGIGACRAIMNGETIGRLLPYYIVSFLGLYVYFSVSGLVDIQGKRDRLKINLTDYLENHMVNRLRQSVIDQAEIMGEPLAEPIKKSMEKPGSEPEPEVTQVIMEEPKTLVQEPEIMEFSFKETREKEQKQKHPKEKAVFSNKEKKELEELLQEFLV